MSNLGRTPGGAIAKFPHYVWFSVMTVNFISTCGTIFILSSLLDVFVCDLELVIFIILSIIMCRIPKLYIKNEL